MGTYRFYSAADKQQDDIWDYTLDKWGEQQAEKYIKELHEYLSDLAENKTVWRPLPGDIIVPQDLSIAVYFGHFKKHYIFFRELSDGAIGIMTILHDAMDIPVRLNNDLQKISPSTVL